MILWQPSERTVLIWFWLLVSCVFGKLIWWWWWWCNHGVTAFRSWLQITWDDRRTLSYHAGQARTDRSRWSRTWAQRRSRGQTRRVMTLNKVVSRSTQRRDSCWRAHASQTLGCTFVRSAKLLPVTRWPLSDTSSTSTVCRIQLNY